MIDTSKESPRTIEPGYRVIDQQMGLSAQAILVPERANLSELAHFWSEVQKGKPGEAEDLFKEAESLVVLRIKDKIVGFIGAYPLDEKMVNRIGKRDDTVMLWHYFIAKDAIKEQLLNRRNINNVADMALDFMTDAFGYIEKNLNDCYGDWLKKTLIVRKYGSVDTVPPGYIPIWPLPQFQKTPDQVVYYVKDIND